VKKVIATCPICSGDLVISRLSCRACDTRIDTELGFPALMRLPADLQQFALVFLRCRGNIREVEKELGISYPTVCKRLDLLNELLEAKDTNGGPPTPRRSPPERAEILARVERGEITAREAADLLKGR
jgi:hypothetical protein